MLPATHKFAPKEANCLCQINEACHLYKNIPPNNTIFVSDNWNVSPVKYEYIWICDQ